MPRFRRIILVVLDSVGIGALPDACQYGDVGCNTIVNTASAVNGLRLPHMEEMGLGKITPIMGVADTTTPQAAYGKMAMRSAGKDTTTGHWELAGLILDRPFPTYPEGFPSDLIKRFEQAIGRPVIGNKPASGTVIINELGDEHLRTGYPIVYTSADSVFQIAAHEEVVPIEELYRYCTVAREMLQGEHAVGRVIARPFTGSPGEFRRTERRHDYSLPPVGPTVLDALQESDLEIIGVGKIQDIFAGRGITRSIKAKNNQQAVEGTLQALALDLPGLIFVNLIDFDMIYGHRNDPRGYATALEAFDAEIPRLRQALEADDLLMITADHGCDPTTSSTDHSREFVPLLVHADGINPVDLGTRETFADCAATIGDNFGLGWPVGRSFLGQL
ncbi:MAG: phosphopentomutase [Clostridia bacterium]|nr:phosphopentomutase [Clostridia bacterium]